MIESDEEFSRAVRDFENRQIYHEIHGYDDNSEKMSPSDREYSDYYKSKEIEELRRKFKNERE